MVTLVSSALSVGPFFVQSAWALPYVSSVSVSPSSTEKTQGETATYTVTVTRASGQASGSVDLSFQSQTITSSEATFSNSRINFGNGGSNTRSVTLEISTDELSIQEHTFTVKGTRTGAQSDSATSSSTTLIVTEPPNQEPTADAGADQTVNEGDSVSLDGSGSTDQDGTIESYSWTQTAGTAATLSGADSATPSFTAPDVGADGDTLTFELTVDDGNGHTATDTVNIGVQNVNQPPVASLTANPTTIEEGSTSALDASASTDDGGIAQYTFEQVGGTAGTITVDSNDPSKAIFQAPSVSADETATIRVTVTDAQGATASATADIVVTNAAPHATTLTLNPISAVLWGNDVTVTGKLSDNAASGAGVGGVTITFSGTGAANLQPVTTNVDGTFTAKGKSSTSVATGWRVQAHFAGDSDYTASTSPIRTYATTKHWTVVALTATATTPWGMPKAFTVTVTDGVTGTVLEGKTISFDGTGVIGVANVITGADGKATGTGTAPDTVATGWTYQAHFAGDSLYLAKDSVIRTYSTTKHTTSLSISVPTTAVAPGASYKVTGTLEDTTARKQIASKTITFTADAPITITDKTTNINGYYSATQPAPSSPGTYNIQTHFAGDDKYNARDSVVRSLTVQ
jgi:hypothetical protein